MQGPDVRIKTMGEDMPSTEPINDALAVHQAEVEEWEFAELTASLQRWADRMILEFKLEIGTPALMIEQLHRYRLGHYRHGRNGFGLRDEIAIDEEHARCSESWRVLGTLAHEMLHSWQEHHGTPGKWNYHNKEFRRKAEQIGLIIDERGVTEYTPAPTPFWELLGRHDIAIPELPAPMPRETRRGSSKLKLYECPCGVKIRSGRSTLRVLCLECEGPFELRE